MRCCVPYCNNVFNNDSKSRGISFHALPGKISRREAWIKALCMTKCNFPLNASVCSEHFSKESIKFRIDGGKRLHKDAIPLSVQVCLICLDTDGVLRTLNHSKLDMAYESLTGLSISNSHVETICDGCARRLTEFCHFRDECLKANQIMMELAEKGSLTVQNIRNIKQNNQINSNENEHKSKDNDTQTEINALHETVDVKFEISEEIYDVYTDNESDTAFHINFETGEINHEQNGELSTEYGDRCNVRTVNAIQVNQNEPETFAPYIEVERIEGLHALKNGKIIENVMGKSRDEIKMYLRRTDDDTVEIYVIENENNVHDETGIFITTDEVQKNTIHASETEKTVEPELQIRNVETEPICEDKAKEIYMNNIEVPERTIKDEYSESEISSTHNEIDDTESSQITKNTTETNRREAVVYEHKEQREEFKEKTVKECIENEEESLIEENMETKESQTNEAVDNGIQSEEESLIEDNTETEESQRNEAVEGSIQNEEESLVDNMESLNDKSDSENRDRRNEVMDEILTDEIKERRVDENESELNRVKSKFKCSKCSGTFLYEKSYKNHVEGCNKSNTQERIKKIGNFILKFDKALLKKNKTDKVKEKQISSQRKISKTKNMDSDDVKRTKREVRLKFNFISKSSKSYQVRTPSNFANTIRYSKAKSFKCENCKYRCTTRKLLNQHILVHTGEKPYSCHLCEYKCAQKGHLDQHLRTHTGVKPYFCEFCEYRCAQKSQLDQHLRRHTGVRPYSCTFCKYTCSQMSHLDQHHRVHTGTKPYACKFCGYRFVQKNSMVKHLKIHDHDHDHDHVASS